MNNRILDLDLHGYTKLEAEAALTAFFPAARQHNIHEARVITGWGVHSPYGRPILKEFVLEWLADRGYRVRQADPKEGGAGALIVRF
jgi:DNA-nicking Smr family endonuclease